MRHLHAHRKLRRPTAHRLSLLRNLVTSLLEHERITTTDAKAKAMRPIAERIITYGKRGDLHARRRALRVVRSREVVHKVFESVAKRFADRPGGYTRIVKLGRRTGDGAPLSIIELLPEVQADKPAPSAKAKKHSTKRKADAKVGAKPAPKAEKGRPEKARAPKPRRDVGKAKSTSHVGLKGSTKGGGGGEK
jgi:large subunit ribosomal protein L17